MSGHGADGAAGDIERVGATVDVIDDYPKNHAFSNVFEAACVYSSVRATRKPR